VSESPVSPTILGALQALVAWLDDEQVPNAIIGAVDRFEREPPRLEAAGIREQALRFSAARFCRELAELVERAWDRFQTQHTDGAQVNANESDLLLLIIGYITMLIIKPARRTIMKELMIGQSSFSLNSFPSLLSI